MKTIEVNIYKFNELSQEAKEVAVKKYLATNWEYAWHFENAETLKEFESAFPVRVSKWEYGYHNFIDHITTCEDHIEDLKGIRLRTYILNNYYSILFPKKYRKHLRMTEKPIYHARVKTSQISHGPNKGKYMNSYYSGTERSNDCPLTGYGIDMEILWPIYEFLKKPCEYTTFGDLLNDCLNNWVSACGKDYEHSQSFEYISEELEVNEYDFTEDGKLY